MPHDRDHRSSRPATRAARRPAAQRDRHAWRRRRRASTIAWRNLLSMLRTPAAARVHARIQPIIFVLMFRYVFGGAITVPGESYVELPDAGHLRPDGRVRLDDHRRSGWPRTCRAGSSTGSARCRWRGRRCSPGRTIADLVRNVFVVILMAVVGFARRLPRADERCSASLAALAIMLLFAFALSWVFAYLRARDRATPKRRKRRRSRSSRCSCSRRRRSCPLDTMPGWLQAFAKHQPVTAAINAVRALVLGGPTASDVVRAARVVHRDRRRLRAARGAPLPPLGLTGERARRSAQAASSRRATRSNSAA